MHLIIFVRIDRKIEKLYLPTLTLSTEADFHKGSVEKELQQLFRKLQKYIVKVTYLAIYK